MFVSFFLRFVDRSSFYNDRFFYQLDAQILYFNTFITFLYMVRALMCSSSGGQIVLVQHLVCHSLWVTVQYTGHDRTVLTCVT